MALETKALQLEAERARLLDHSTNRGSEAEHSILRWIRARYAPWNSVSSGEIIDSFETNSELRSRQQDGVLHQNGPEASRFLLPSGLRLIPIETVIAVVEVKLTLTKDEFERADRAAEETARLRLRPGASGRIIEQMDGGSLQIADVTPEQRRLGIAVGDPAFRTAPVVFTLFAFGGVERLETIQEWMKASTISIVCCLSAGCVVRG